MSDTNGANLTRRRFLRGAAQAGGAFAASQIIPASALGRGGLVAPSERITMAIIGVGGRGSGDLGVVLGQPDVQLVAVCDVQKNRRTAAKNAVDAKYQTKDCVPYSDMRLLLADRSDVDAVLIATGDRWHALASVMAMRAGKDVYCEKPSCFTIAQGQAVVETAKKFGRVYQTGTQRLSESNHVFAIEMARTGRLGKIHTAYADIRYRGGSRLDFLPAEPEPPKDELDWDLWLGPSPWRPYNKGYVGHNWYNFNDFATDVAMWGAHTIAQVLPGLDLTGATTLEFEFAEPNGNIVTRFSNGLKLVLFRKGPVWQPCEFWHGACGERFDGPGGWVAAADGYARPDVSSPALLGDYRKVLAEYVARTQRPMDHIRDFLNCVKSRRPTVASPEVMCQSMAICLAADLCERLKRNLTFDLRTYEFVGDAQANRLTRRTMRTPWSI